MIPVNPPDKYSIDSLLSHLNKNSVSRDNFSSELKKLLLFQKHLQVQVWTDPGSGPNYSTGSPMALSKSLLGLFLNDKVDSGAQHVSRNLWLKNKVHSQYIQESTETAKTPSYLENKGNSFHSIKEMIHQKAEKYGLDKEWFQKLIHAESGFNPKAESRQGAMGLGQIMPATAKELGLRVGEPEDDSEGSVWNSESNLDASARYLRQLQDMYSSMGIAESEIRSFTAAAYNAGMGNLQKAIDKLGDFEKLSWNSVAKTLPEITGSASRETLNYVKKLEAG